jgi:hypothetical protein
MGCVVDQETAEAENISADDHVKKLGFKKT